MEIVRMTAKEQVRVLNQNRMGGLRSNSPPDSDYVFMQPNSVPVLKCVTAELQKISQKSPKEGVYMNPRSLQPGAEGMQSSLYKMVDMSELHTSPEMPETVTEIVTPSETRRADFKSALRRMSSNPKTEENPVISKRNQKIIFPFSKTSNMHKISAPSYENHWNAQLSNHQTVEDEAKCEEVVYTEMLAQDEFCADINDNIRSKSEFVKNYIAATSRRREDSGMEEEEMRTEEGIYSEVWRSDSGDCDTETWARQCMEYTGPSKTCMDPQMPTYRAPEPPAFPALGFGHRRLPPTPVEEKTFAEEAGKHLRVERRSSIPKHPPPLPPTPDSSPSTSPIGKCPLADLTPVDVKSENPKSLKSRSTSLFNINFFGKNQKQNGNNETNCKATEKKSEKTSPKFSQKIHPIADMIKKRRNTPVLLLSSKLKPTGEASSKKQAPSFSNDSAVHKMGPASKKPELVSTKAVPLSNGRKSEGSFKSKILTTIKSAPSILPESQRPVEKSETSSSFSQPKQSPKPLKSQSVVDPEKSQKKSFLYQKAPELRFDDQPRDKNDKKPPSTRHLMRAHTVDVIAADVVTADVITAEVLSAESYEVPFYLQKCCPVESTLVNGSVESDFAACRINNKSPRSKANDRFSSPAALGRSIDSKRNQFEPKASEAIKGPNKLEKGFPNSHPTPGAAGYEKKEPKSQFQNKPTSPPPNLSQGVPRREPPSRPPPPSLQKIREARIKKNLNRKELPNRSMSERWAAENPSSIEVRNRFAGQRSKHLSNPELLPLPDEDDEYSEITEDNDAIEDRSKMRYLRNKNFAGASAMTTIKSKINRAKLRYGDVTMGGSVESVESDSSSKDSVESEGIYEAIDAGLTVRSNNIAL